MKSSSDKHFDYKMVITSTVMKWPLLVICVLLSYFFFNAFILGTTITMGNSMKPTLESGEYCILNKWIYHLRSPKRGEIVVIDLPHTGEFLVKRIIGLPNDIVEIRNGAVYLNGRVLGEPYLPVTEKTEPEIYGLHKYRIKSGSYFVLGDNRDESLDSRIFGMVKRNWIVGKVGS